jgi:hypothetical protein
MRLLRKPLFADPALGSDLTVLRIDRCKISALQKLTLPAGNFGLEIVNATSAR